MESHQNFQETSKRTHRNGPQKSVCKLRGPSVKSCRSFVLGTSLSTEPTDLETSGNQVHQGFHAPPSSMMAYIRIIAELLEWPTMCDTYLDRSHVVVGWGTLPNNFGFCVSQNNRAPMFGKKHHGWLIFLSEKLRWIWRWTPIRSTQKPHVFLDICFWLHSPWDDWYIQRITLDEKVPNIYQNLPHWSNFSLSSPLMT